MELNRLCLNVNYCHFREDEKIKNCNYSNNNCNIFLDVNRVLENLEDIDVDERDGWISHSTNMKKYTSSEIIGYIENGKIPIETNSREKVIETIKDCIHVFTYSFPSFHTVDEKTTHIALITHKILFVNRYNLKDNYLKRLKT